MSCMSKIYINVYMMVDLNKERYYTYFIYCTPTVNMEFKLPISLSHASVWRRSH